MQLIFIFLTQSQPVMLSFRSKPFFLLLLSSSLHHFLPFLMERKIKGVEEWNATRGRLLEGEEPSDNNSSETLILAANRTHRRDPLNGFRYYTGGWNILDKHYLSSAAFTAVPLFVVSAIWFVGYALYVCCACLCCCCSSRKDHYGSSSSATLRISLVLLILFGVAAIIASGFLYAGEEQFYKSTERVLNYIIDQAKTVIDNLANFQQYLGGVKTAGGEEASVPADSVAQIDNMNDFIDFIIGQLQYATKHVHFDIGNFLSPFIIPITWISTAGTFFMSGMFLLVHIAVADTCVAMDEWLENPTANSALKDILPAANQTYVREITRGTRDVTFSLVNGTNDVISNVFNADYLHPDAGPPLFFNQSGPYVPLLCNPYNPNLTDRKCQPDEVDFQRAPQEWKKFVCEVSPTGICITPGRITPDGYNDLTKTLNTTYGLYEYGPFLADMASFTYVKDTFSNVSDSYCPDISLSTEMTCASFIVIAVSLMLSMILWMIYAQQRRNYKHYKKLQRKNKKNSPAL
ncbi:hypothetical protein NMG60_11036346 [Bertholletia excelsa]